MSLSAEFSWCPGPECNTVCGIAKLLISIVFSGDRDPSVSHRVSRLVSRSLHSGSVVSNFAGSVPGSVASSVPGLELEMLNRWVEAGIPVNLEASTTFK